MSKVSLEDQWTIFGIFPRSSVTPVQEKLRQNKHQEFIDSLDLP